MEACCNLLLTSKLGMLLYKPLTNKKTILYEIPVTSLHVGCSCSLCLNVVAQGSEFVKFHKRFTANELTKGGEFQSKDPVLRAVFCRSAFTSHWTPPATVSADRCGLKCTYCK